MADVFPLQSASVFATDPVSGEDIRLRSSSPCSPHYPFHIAYVQSAPASHPPHSADSPPD